MFPGTLTLLKVALKPLQKSLIGASEGTKPVQTERMICVRMGAREAPAGLWSGDRQSVWVSQL